MQTVLRHLLAALAAFVFFTAAAWAQDQSPVAAGDGPKVQVSLVSEHPSVAPGQTVFVALREIIRKDWHTYWRNPGDSGQPTVITWKLPAGWKAGEIQWPYPERIPVGPLMNFGYSDEVLLMVPVTAPADARPGSLVTLNAHALWLVCKEVCIPEEADVSLTLPIVGAPAAPDAGVAPMFAAARAKHPHASPWQARWAADDKTISLFLASPELARAKPKRVVFFPYTDGYVQPPSEQRIGMAADGLVLSAATGWRLNTAAKRAGISRVDGIVVVTDSDGRTESLEIAAAKGEVLKVAMSAPAGGEGGIDLTDAILFALLGGLILNLMPCVLPVLSMKALALARKAGSPHAAHGESLAYGAGVLVTFAALSGLLIILKEGGAAIGWGFQLQEPIVVVVFALLMLAVGLNLAGVFEIGGRFAGAGQGFASKGGVAGSFFTGALAVVVATPCTAPFMGAALGFALTQDALTSTAVFLALGVGFALPFFLLGYLPALLRLIPRPGPWMTTFRQFLAFPMFGTAAWLLWLLERQAGSIALIAGLAAALALAFALWAYGRNQNSGGGARVVWIVVALLSLGAAVWAAMQIEGVAAPSQSQAAGGALRYEAYSEKRLAELRAAGRPVFLNATADWCITCLLNERVALETERVVKAFTANQVAALKADWTRRDAAIAALLARYGRQGVPLYLYFAPGADEAVILPQLLTPDIVLSVIEPRR